MIVYISNRTYAKLIDISSVIHYYVCEKVDKWEHVKADLVQTPDGYIIFDDTLLEKRHAEKTVLAKQQYSGNARKVVNSIGVVTCVYVNPALDGSWLIDYRIYDKQGDGKTKLDHVQDLLAGRYQAKKLHWRCGDEKKQSNASLLWLHD